MPLTVRTITDEEHLEYAASRPSVSFLQLPSWGRVKSAWRSESLGWFDADELVGAGLVLYRGVPRVPQRTLAYLPEGPDLDWTGEELPQYGLNDWLTPMVAHLRARGSFAVKMGPPVVVRRWEAATVKKAISDGQATRLRNIPPDEESASAIRMGHRLRHLGWQQEVSEGAGFGDFQPRYVFQVPLSGRSRDDVFSGLNQLWRRNIRKAAKLGVEVSRGSEDDLPDFHRIYAETAERDGFLPRPLSYFEQMFKAMNDEHPDRVRLYLAKHEGELVAATTMVTVGEHAWYSYGASTTAGQRVRPSNAIQWAMIGDALDDGCAVYDMRGISDTLDESDHLFGLIRFKVGTGGRAVEYAGEWDFPIRPLWHKAFQTYMKRR